MAYLNAFLCGGLLCAVGQILIDRTRLTPARILTGYVVAGVFLSAVGLYQPLADWGGAGATVPLTGFGYCLAKGVAKAVAEKGLLGALTGGLTAAAGGIAAAVVFGVLAALAAAGVDPLMPWLLSFAAGAMLYVVVEELIPQAHSRAGTCGFVMGFLVMMVLDVALGG